MSLHICSLIANGPQVIPAGGAYQVLRFPYGAAESYDAWCMHQAEQPDGHHVTGWDADDRSGLIWPAVVGWGTLYAMIHWRAGDYTEIRSQFVRDPLAAAPNTTATEDHPATIGGQYRAKSWPFFVQPGTPLALRVNHNGFEPAEVFHAQLKLVIDDDVATP